MDSSLSPRKKRVLAGVLGLALVTMAAYLPALGASYIWDDDQHLTANPLLTEAGGLGKVWTTPGGFYYPLVLTTFWGIRQVWDLHPLPYHLLNILLHSANALLLWGLLARLTMPGAWFAAALFALHPVQVESVAWITELKNIQSGFFYLLSFHALLTAWPVHNETHGHAEKKVISALAVSRLGQTGWYCAGLVAFALAVLSKPSTVMLPVVILGYLIWRQHRIVIRDVLSTLPFFLLSVAASLWTIWEQKYHSMAQGEDWSVPFVERLLNAPHIIGFYLWKLVWPHPLMFIYPKWEIDPGKAATYLPALLLVMVTVLLFFKRRSWGEGPLLALAYFVITLFPVLGFFNIYFMTYSWVADHFQYLASIGPLALGGYLAARYVRLSEAKGGGEIPRTVGGLILLTLFVCTWRQTLIYQNEETLWKDAIARNPKAAMAYNNLGTFLSNSARMGEAIPYFERALELRPEDGEYHYNLALALGRSGQVEASALHFQKAIDLNPMEPQAYSSYASLLAAVGKNGEAIALYEKALDVAPQTPEAADTHLLVAGLLRMKGENTRALQHYEEALRIQPGNFDARVGLGVLLEGMGQVDRARQEYQAALDIHPDHRISTRLKKLEEGKPSENGLPVNPSTPPSIP